MHGFSVRSLKPLAIARKLQRDASKFLNADVKKAVITVPACAGAVG